MSLTHVVCPFGFPAEAAAHLAFLRGLLERMLLASQGTAAVDGACLHSCLLVAESLEQFTDLAPVIRGGSPEEGAGYLDAAGALHGHYWVETTAPAGAQRWVICLTSDQFGGQAVEIVPIELARRRFIPGCDATVQQHAAELREAIRQEGGAQLSGT